MQKNNLLISIITPTFNRGDFIEKTILSIKNQDYPLIEHIVVDGLSTDNTKDILKKYEGTYNLRWISEKDKGCADAMNKGFAMAKGDIICWLDSDDVYLPGTIKRVIEVFEQRPDITAVFGNVVIADENDKIINYERKATFDFETLIYNGMSMSPQTTFWRKALHDNVGELDISFSRCADHDFFIRLAKAGAKFYHINKYLAAYRVHSNQLTGDVGILRKEQLEIARKYWDKNLTPQSLWMKRKKITIKRMLYFAARGQVWHLVRALLVRLGIIKIYSSRTVHHPLFRDIMICNQRGGSYELCFRDSK
jgi:glycosyltransferase involved in cell wall biosynthesis